MASTSALPAASPRTSRSEETTPPFAAADGPSIERQLSPLSDGGFESKIRVGMSDVDAYGFLYYASYLKYNERATNHVSSGLVLRGLEFMKFAKSVHWGKEVLILTFKCPEARSSSTDLVAADAAAAAASSTLRLAHVWLPYGGVDADAAGPPSPAGASPTSPAARWAGAAAAVSPYNIAITLYELPADPAARAAANAAFHEPGKTHPLFRQLYACVRESVTPLPPLPPTCTPLAAHRQRDLQFTIAPDAIGYGGRLQPSVALDLFERQRTAIIGGQPALAWLDREGIAVVVYRLRHMRLPIEPVPLGRKLLQTSAEDSANVRRTPPPPRTPPTPPLPPI